MKRGRTEPVSDSGKVVHLRLSSSDDKRLGKLGGAIPLTRSGIVREAMRLGMTQLEGNPGAFVGEAISTGGA